MTKTKHSARKASMGDAAPLAKQIKIEKEDPVTARIILDSNKVEEATKSLGKIPKKTAKSLEGPKEDDKDIPILQVSSSINKKDESGYEISGHRAR